jgi:FkbM family methyltransferase
MLDMIFLQISVKKIILIEPFESLHDSLRSCYEGFSCPVHYEAVCITQDENIKQVNLFSPNNESTVHASLYPMKDWNATTPLAAGVPATTINNIFDKYNITDVGLLFIDTEGNDAKIINSIDFSRVDVQAIIYEYWGFARETFVEYDPLNGIDGMNYIASLLTNLGYSIGTSHDMLAGSGMRADVGNGNFLAIKNC